jgi:perosamine synthetase
VHVFGRPCDLDSLLYLSSRFGLTVIEDSCEAIGARYRGRCCGTFGQTGVFAFYPNKQITTGEGGIIVTASESVARLCRSWRNQGRSDSAAWLLHERLGYNYRLSDIQCALGAAQVSRLEEILGQRSQAAAMYSRILADEIPELGLPAPAEPDTTISWFVYVVRLPDSCTASHRDAVIDFLRSRGIGCSNYFAPIHLQPYFVERFGYRRGDFPVTEFISDRTIALPFFTRISEDQIRTVVSTLQLALRSIKPVHTLSASAVCTGSISS